MDVIARPRRGGKTHELVQWVKEGVRTDSYPFWSRVILTYNISEAARLRKDHGLDYRQVFSANEWKNARLGVRPVEVAFDNLDQWLWMHFGSVRIITVTGGEV